jgi:hypothetical protein
MRDASTRHVCDPSEIAWGGVDIADRGPLLSADAVEIPPGPCIHSARNGGAASAVLGSEQSVTRNLLCGCHEHLGRDARLSCPAAESAHAARGPIRLSRIEKVRRERGC